MFNNDTWRKIAEQLGDKWAEVEASLILKINAELAKDINLSKQDYTNKRLNDARRIELLLARESSKYIKPLTEMTKESLEVASKEAVKEVEQTFNQELSIVPIEETAIKAQVIQTVNFTINQAMTSYRSIVQNVPLDPDDVFNQIKNASRDIIDKGFKTYSNGKLVSFRSYMEMKGRTDANNAALKNLEESSKLVGAGYFLASEHFDCADDHAEWQGKFYLADGVVDEWNGKYERLSKAKEAGFLTRPNCRHYITPVTKDQLGKVTTDELNMRKGHYKPENYDILQEQRKNERMIVHYKNRLESDTILLNKTKDPTQRAEINNRIQDTKSRIGDWQKRQRENLKGTALKRDYRREQPGIVVRDLGVRYQSR